MHKYKPVNVVVNLNRDFVNNMSDRNQKTEITLFPSSKIFLRSFTAVE